MPVHYDISPSLNLVLYICTETVSTVKFFEAGDRVTLDSRLSQNTSVIIDFYLAELEVSVTDLRFAIEKMMETKQSRQILRRAQKIVRIVRNQQHLLLRMQ